MNPNQFPAFVFRNCLGDTDRPGANGLMPHTLQSLLDLFGKIPFEQDPVRRPLMMESRVGNTFLKGTAQFKESDGRQQALSNNFWATGSAHCHDGLIVFEDYRG